MDLFGLKEHDERHAEVERRIRYLLEQVAQLTIDLGEAHADIRRLQREVDSKVSAADVDPALTALDEGLADARSKLGAAQSASEDGWSDVYSQLETSIGNVRDAVDAAGSTDDDDGPESSSGGVSGA